MRSCQHVDQLTNAAMAKIIEMLFKELTREEDLKISRLDGYDAGLKEVIAKITGLASEEVAEL